NEAIANFEQIISFFNPQGKERIYPLYEQLISIKKDIEQNKGVDQIHISNIIHKIENFKRHFETEFSYTDAKKWMD
ncbi:MAG: hypothetical protein NC925_03550, partial [Candidatus Omnitrophica bacterium]|nr:hypothetical protein [Candidatus Omnitrophota bacterium]